MNKKVEVIQEGKNDCAAACLLSIIKYHGGNLDIESIKEIINTNRNGTNAYDLIEGSKRIGFDACGKKITFDNLIKEKNILPLIAHTKKHNMYHFVVIYKIDFKKNKILIMDPTIGLTYVSFNTFEKSFLNTILIFSIVKDLPKIKKENKLFKLIIESILKKKKEIIILSILSLLTFIFTIIDTFYYKILFDNKINERNIYYKYLILFIIILIIKNIIMFYRNKKRIKIDDILDKSINEYSLNKIFSLPYSYYKNKSTGEVVSRINDLEILKNLLSNLILNTFVNIFLIIISFIIIFIINKELVIISLIIIFSYFLIIKIFNTKYITHIRILSEEKGYYNELLTESIDNIESISNLNIIKDRLKVLNENYNTMLDLNKKISNLVNKENFLKNIIYEMGLIIIITIGMILVKNNKLNIGDLLLFYMLINFFISSIKELFDKHLEITFTLKKIERVNSLFISEEKNKETNNKIEGNIIVKNLNFTYGKDIKVLNNKNLIIKKGEKVLITGKSGCGKSTLIKIILKYLNNYKGEVFIGNKNLLSIDKSIINNSFNYIGQNERLFTDSFKNNITLNREVTEYEYEKILNTCELKTIRDKRKLKNDFMIEESGFNLSGGERQRIILARALIKKANFIIIDEALSEVNISVEEKIIKNIFESYKDKTIIYITHKKEIKRLFNRVYNLERSIYE